MRKISALVALAALVLVLVAARLSLKVPRLTRAS